MRELGRLIALHYSMAASGKPVSDVEAMREWVAFVRALKDGPAGLLPREVQSRLVELGKSDPEFLRAFRIVDTFVCEEMRRLVTEECAEPKEPGFLEGGSAQRHQERRDRWLARRQEVVADYVDLLEQWGK